MKFKIKENIYTGNNNNKINKKKYKHALSPFCSLDAGNVEKNVEFFNKAMGSGDSTATGEATAVGEAFTQTPTYTFKYIGPVYRFEGVYDTLDKPIYTDAQSKQHAANMIKGKLKNKYGFSYNAKLGIDEDKVELVTSNPDKVDIKDKEEIIHDDKDYIETINNHDVYFENGYYVVDGLENIKFISEDEIRDYLEESYMSEKTYSIFSGVDDNESLQPEKKSLNESLDKKEKSDLSYNQLVERLGQLDYSSLYRESKFYNLKNRFKVLMEDLSYEDRKDLKDVIDATKNMDDDKAAETIAAVLAAKDKKDESLEEKLVDAPQEVIDKLLEILNRYGFVLDDSVGHENPTKSLIFGDVHIQVINPNSQIDLSNDNIQDQLKSYVSRNMIDEIQKLEDESNCPITWNFGSNREGRVTGGLDIMKQYVEENLNEASYGGAYDIEDDMYFTKDDMYDFLYELIDKLKDAFGYDFDIYDAGFDTPTDLYIELTDNTHDLITDNHVHIDMRKIKVPSDLNRKYLDSTFELFKNDFQDLYDEYNFDESLIEDVVEGTPYNYEELERELKAASNDWTKDPFRGYVSFVEEFDDAIQILSKHYENVKKLRTASNRYGFLATRPSLFEDTVKQDGKWVNKGKEGTHGEFRTKKAADAQRKAMFAQGYKAEALDNDDEYAEFIKDKKLINKNFDREKYGKYFDKDGKIIPELQGEYFKAVAKDKKKYVDKLQDKNLNESGYEAVISDLESIEKFLNNEKFDNYEVYDYDNFPMETSKIEIKVEGDWKHDHLLFKHLIQKWADENNRKIFKIDSQEVGHSDSDYYTAIYNIFIAKDDDSFNTLNSMRGLFGESLKEVYQEVDPKNYDKYRALLIINHEGGNSAQHLYDLVMKYQPNAEEPDDLTDETIEKVYDELVNKYKIELAKYGDDAEVDYVAIKALNLDKAMNESWDRDEAVMPYNEPPYPLYEQEMIDEDLIISPNKEYLSKSGHRILIKEVDPYISEYDGTANLRIKYDYKLKDSNEWGSSECNNHDLFRMLNEDWNIEDQLDAPETIGKLNPGDKFKNRNGVEITIIEPQKDGTIQFKIGDEVRAGSERSIQRMLYRNNYLREDYQHDNDNWGDPYTYEEVERELSKLTNKFTDKKGNIRCYWEQEKEFGLQILGDHYEKIEVIDGDTGPGEDMSWVISYAHPKEKLDENLNEARISPLKDSIIDCLDWFILMEMDFPKDKFLADSWEDVKDGIQMGLDPEFEVAEGIKEYLEPIVKFNKRYNKEVEEEGVFQDEIEMYQRLVRNMNKYLTDNGYEANITEAYMNNIDKDLIQGASGEGQNLITDNNNKCSKSAINNIINQLKQGKSCQLCLGSFIINGSATKNISHAWVVTEDGKIIETSVPNIDNLSRQAIKCINFIPKDLNNLETILTQELYK